MESASENVPTKTPNGTTPNAAHSAASIIERIIA
jgi:hypothetical protein